MRMLEIFQFPLSLVSAAAFIAALLHFHLRWHDKWISRLCRSWVLTLSLLTLAIVALAVEGTWGIDIHHSIPFVILTLLMTFSLGMCTLESLHSSSKAFILSHTGMFLILFGGCFGAPDTIDAHIIVNSEEPKHIAVGKSGEAVPLPFEISLQSFGIDYYDDGTSPRQFTSTVLIDGKQETTSVNHPCLKKGYFIYQADYGEGFSVLKIVRDPWIPLVFLGMLLLVIGNLLGLFKAWNSWKVFLIAFALAVVFGIISIARINFSTLMPALRSLWFVPHLAVYMIAYALLAVAFILSIISLIKKNWNNALPSQLLKTASALLLIGMICGAVWAKFAWGDYWTWDSKECWAAVTWILTLIGTHLPKTQKKWPLAVAIIVSFAAIQITWYGVNYLPAATQSLHTYNIQ